MSEPVIIVCACFFCGGNAISLYADDTASITWCEMGHVMLHDSLAEKEIGWKKIYDFSLHK